MGPFTTLFNDFGQSFDVLDKDGEDPVEVFISNISNENKGTVKLLSGTKHPYEDGDKVMIN